MPDEFMHATALLNSSMLTGHVTPTPLVHERLAGVFVAHPSPLAVKLVATLVTYWGTDIRESDITGFTTDVKTLTNVLLTCLEEEIGRECVGRICGFITCSRYGVSDAEVVDMLGFHVVAIAVDGAWFADPESKCVLPLLWPWVKERLTVLLFESVSDGVPLSRWKHVLFGDIVTERYASLLDTTSRTMLEYFTPVVIDTPDGRRRACALARRVADEWPYQLYRSGLCRPLLERCLFDATWLCDKLRMCGLYEVLLDVALAKRLDPSSAELDFLTDWLSGCSARLLQDPFNLCTYLHLATATSVSGEARRHHANVDRLLTAAGDRVLPLLTPAAEACDQPGESPTGLFRLKNDPSHMLSVSTAAGQLTVWNVYSCTATRKLIGLDRPRDVNMYDAVKAIVLCDRHLEVIDLDRGVVMSRLKGVLSIKMPYFGIHDDEHVIALSRNRMCVNMMSNADGDVVTTFKVGEDRFLDSLLVSANGKVCVCGDAVQKPFPLLVWDMCNRKLLHDLRIPGHEFITRIAAISSEGHYVVCACKVRLVPASRSLSFHDKVTMISAYRGTSLLGSNSSLDESHPNSEVTLVTEPLSYVLMLWK